MPTHRSCRIFHPGYIAASDPVRFTIMPVRNTGLLRLGHGVDLECLVCTALQLPAAPGPARFAGMLYAQCYLAQTCTVCIIHVGY